MAQVQMDVFANLTKTVQTAKPCGRSKCKTVIQPGEEIYYIRDQDETKPGKHVCLACFHYYRGDAATVIRPSSSQKQPTIMSKKDIQVIRRDVNESQRQGTSYQSIFICPVNIEDQRRSYPPWTCDCTAASFIRPSWSWAIRFKLSICVWRNDQWRVCSTASTE